MSSSRPMSTSPEPIRASPEDEIVSALSHWLAFHIGNSELRLRLAEIPHNGLQPVQVDALQELVVELDGATDAQRGSLEMLVRETMEAVAVG
jgi:hypothetical protein